MDVKPLRTYRTPSYPTRLAVLADPQLLERHIPPGWRLSRELAGVAAVLLAANGCLKAGEPAPPEVKPAVVAPIFQHGEGRGVAGCVMVSPAVFLSEEEALQVIAEELAKSGVDVSTQNVPLTGVAIPQRQEDFTRTATGEGKTSIKSGINKPLTVDILDDKLHVAVEYVAAEDYLELGGVASMMTVQEYDFRGVARDVAYKARETRPDVQFGAFYDPTAKMDRVEMRQDPDGLAEWKLAHAAATEESKRLLRLQVQDFIEWLKGQGVI